MRVVSNSKYPYNSIAIPADSAFLEHGTRRSAHRSMRAGKGTEVDPRLDLPCTASLAISNQCVSEMPPCAPTELAFTPAFIEASEE